jgi:FlaA1/EpsC-like NDP-sugar epimerase
MDSLRNRHYALLDLVLLAGAAVLAFVLRLDASVLWRYGDTILWYVAVAVPVRMLVFCGAGLYARYWRYASVDELVLIAKASGVGTLAVAVMVLLILPWLSNYPTCPRSVPFIDGMLVLFVAGMPRFWARLAWRNRRRGERSACVQVQRRVLIMGAGDAGQMLVEEMMANPQLGLVPVGFIDDDTSKHGMQIHGLRILGDREDIPRLARVHKAEEVVIAMPTAPGRAIREVLEICEHSELPASIIPGLYDILSGAMAITQVHEVQIEDLLRREPVIVDPMPVEEMVRGARVLVTGAGGSIGSELCRQIARCEPETLILLGHGENSIYHIANELHERWPALHLETVIADVRDAARLRHVLAMHQPVIVCHAAAHKHVPMMEANLIEAVTNNVLGTQTLVRACEAAGVERFVLISTDKAVEPTSVMGVTKRVAELLVQQSARRSGRRYLAVRFGNVLGSRGSVVPFFQAQIARGGPVTVTHPEMRRYFMTIPEAVQLVLQAAALGEGGEVFILDMGEPVKILDLAVDLIRLSGLRPRVCWPGETDRSNGRGHDWDIKVIFTGLRPGEKLYEELIVEGEEAAPTCHEKILISRNGCGRLPCPVDLADAVAELEILALEGNEEGCREVLHEIVPGYQVMAEGQVEDPTLVPATALHAEPALAGD